MASSARQTIACIFFILTAAICLQSQTVPAKVSTASINGKVTLKGKGAGGIVVGLRRVESGRQESTLYNGVTDEQGVYRISNVLPGTYQVAAVAPAFVIKDDMGQGKTLIVNKDEAIEDIDFEMVRGGVITGRVTDRDGRAIVEEQVSIQPVQTERQGSYRWFSGQTDDRGVYRIFGLAAGQYKVFVGQSDGSFGRFGQVSYRRTFHPAAVDISQAATVEVFEGSEVANVDITVGRAVTTYSVRGQIVDSETGRPLPNVPYQLHMFYGGNGGGSMSTGAVSNPAGEFRFDNLAPGKYGVSLEQTFNSELRADHVPFEITDQDVTGLVIKAEKGTTVSGVVVVEGGEDKDIQKKLSRAYVHAWMENSGSSPDSNRTAQIGRDGTFRIAGLQSGMMHISVFSQDQLQMIRVEHERMVQGNSIELRERESVSGVRIVVSYAGGSISGVVKLENGPVPAGSYIYVSLKKLGENEDPSIPRSDMSAQADARGQFVFKPLLPGTYEVSAIRYDAGAQGQMVRAKQQVVVTNGAVTNVTLTLEPGTRRP